jgi:hypothetical protein
MTKPHSPARITPKLVALILALTLAGLCGNRANALAPGIDLARSQLLLLVGSYQVEGTPAMGLFVQSLVCASHSKSLVPIMAELNKASVRDRWFAINKKSIATSNLRTPAADTSTKTLLFKQKMFIETLAKNSTEVDFKAFNSCLNPSATARRK